MAQHNVETKAFDIVPVPEKTYEQNTKFEAKIKVTMIILGICFILANFYMSGIFSALNILVQTQLIHYPYHPI